MNSGLKESLQTRIIHIFRENPKVTKLILFGSRAANSFRNGSDIDLAVHGYNLDSNDINKFENALYNLNTLYKFDVVDIQKLSNQKMKKEILEKGIVLLEKNDFTK